jgi:hypothetical protein
MFLGIVTQLPLLKQFSRLDLILLLIWIGSERVCDIRGSEGCDGDYVPRTGRELADFLTDVSKNISACRHAAL